MKINVIGATGSLGRKVMNELMKQGMNPADLMVTARTPEKAGDLEEKGVDVRKGDYDDNDSLVTAFAGADVVLLIPSLALPEDRTKQHANAVKAAVRAGAKRIVFTSFAAATPESKFHVAPFMLFAESMTRLSGIDWTILRDGIYLDPVAEWVPDLVKMGKLPYPVKHGKVAYISRDDIARAAAAACIGDGHEGKLYELTGPSAVTMSELADAISSASGAPVRFETVTEEEFGEICRVDNVPEHIIDILASMYRAVDNHEFERVTDHVEILTGLRAETIEDYLGRVLKV